MRIAVGKAYMDRKGKRVNIIHKHEGPGIVWPFLGDNGRSYTEEGYYFLGYDKEHDLAYEVKKEPLSLEVGKAYLNRKGEKIKLVELSNQVFWRYLGDSGCSYTKKGKCYFGDSPEDLIKEASEEEHFGAWLRKPEKIKLSQLNKDYETRKHFKKLFDHMNAGLRLTGQPEVTEKFLLLREIEDKYPWIDWEA